MYSPTIGLEIHAELKTRTKMFCDCANDPDETRPNVNICPVCLAHPGTLPVINREAVRHMLRIGTPASITMTFTPIVATVPGLIGLASDTPTGLPGCRPRKDWKLTYTVQANDALVKIAAAYNTSVDVADRPSIITACPASPPSQRMVRRST